MGEQSTYQKFRVWLLSTTAQLMPRDLVYFVLIRVRGEITDPSLWATDSKNNTESPSIDTAISRWYAGSEWLFKSLEERKKVARKRRK